MLIQGTSPAVTHPLAKDTGMDEEAAALSQPHRSPWDAAQGVPRRVQSCCHHEPLPRALRMEQHHEGQTKSSATGTLLSSLQEIRRAKMCDKGIWLK